MSFICPITLLEMKDPYMDKEGNTYEKSAIEQWIQVHHSSPITRSPLTLNDIFPNRALKDMIEAKNNPKSVQESPMNLNVKSLEPVKFGVEFKHFGLETLVKVEPSATNLKASIDICCVIDVSGSMDAMASIPGNNESTGLTILDLVKHAVKTIIKSLDQDDRLSLVSFSDSADLVLELTKMDSLGQATAITALEGLVTLGSTNIWAGLETGMLSFVDSSRLSCIFLLTDGAPNLNPPRGIVPMLEIAKSKEKTPDMINTFGFGYSLDSQLLVDISRVGNGYYSFIPDAGFVGTIFVHAIANMMSLVATKCELRLLRVEASVSIHGLLPEKVIREGDDLVVDLGLVQDGQSLEIILPLETIERIECRIKTRDKHALTVTAVENNDLKEQLYVDCQWRLKFVNVVRNCLASDLSKAQSDIEQFKTELKSIPRTQQSQYLIDLTTDLSGQVAEAFQDQYFQKWGRHYIPSLLYAHLSKTANNFKDPGVQHYGGGLFKEMRDIADELFCKLPPPKRSGGSRGYSTTSNINMAVFNNSSNVCFSGDSVIALENGDCKPVANVRKGDILLGGSIVKLVVRSVVNGSNFMCKLGPNCIATPYHPLFNGFQWQFPIETVVPELYECNYVYNFVLEKNHLIKIGDFLFPTLGHGFDGDTVGHSFFGTEKVLNFLEKASDGYRKACVDVVGVSRDSCTKLINGLRFSSVSLQ